MNDIIGELFNKRESLNPILRAHVVGDGPLGPMIKHPLVHEIMYRPEFNALINARFEAKSQALAEALQEKKWGRAIALYERPYRINILLSHRHEMTSIEYWECVGSIWTDSENIWQCYDDWRTLWESPLHHKKHAMSKAERRQLALMPDTIIVYRGVNGKGVTKARNRIAMSWTTERDIAMKFATMHKQEPIRILEGTVKKSQVHAYFSRRSENEIVSTKVNIRRNVPQIFPEKI